MEQEPKAEEPSSGPAWGAEHNPYKLSASAVESGSIPELKKSLGLARTFFPDFDDGYIPFRDEVFSDVLSDRSQTLLTYMIDNEDVPISAIDPSSIAGWASKPLIEALLARGWDVNMQDPGGIGGKRLIDHLVNVRNDKEDLARWLVDEKGARVDGGEFDAEYVVSARPPPLLETCAAFGTVSMFKFLEEKGARISLRTLHVAVNSAAERGADPGDESSSESAKYNSVEMLRYLVDERQLDVNGMDCSAPHPNANTLTMHWGTPICYAAHCQKGTPVVRWLLKKGANPTIGSLSSGMDAVAVAREGHCDEVLEVLEDWMQQHPQHSRGGSQG